MVDQGRGLPVSVATTAAAVNYCQYPAPLAKYEDIVANPQLFMTTLEKLHAAMATKFMVPIIGGRDLDLHKLFVEVTSRGGIDKILREKRWKEVTSTFNFPTTATNASFVLRKYYYSLLQHYERIYYFKLQGWSTAPDGASQNPSAVPVAVPGMTRATAPIQPATVQQPRLNTVEFVSGVAPAPRVGCPVVGVIDGKFESGYLVTVTLGNEKMKGVLYQTPPAKMNQVPQTSGVSNPATSGVPRRRRRKRRRKTELRKRDPTHPRPNRSGYNFFFAEQRALLKPLHPGKDREISRMIGELWNNLKDNDKAVYQEKAVKDKERYRIEMEDYNERQRENQVISDAVPIQQRFPGLNVQMVEVNVNDGTVRDSPGFPGYESNSSKSGTEDGDDDDDEDDDDDDDDMMEKDDEIFSDAQTTPVLGGTPVESGMPTGTSEASAAATGDFQIAVEEEEKEACDEEEEGSPENVEHENSITFSGE